MNILATIAASISVIVAIVKGLRELPVIIESVSQAYKYIKNWLYPTKPKVKNVYITVDYANIAFGAQNISDGNQDKSVGLNITEFSKLIEEGVSYPEIRRRIALEIPKKNHTPIAKEWESCGYKWYVQGADPINESDTTDPRVPVGEKGDSNTENVFILASGDGSEDKEGQSPLKIVRKLLENNWTVHLWSWKISCSKKFRGIQKDFPKNMTINYLEKHRDMITYTKTKKN